MCSLGPPSQKKKKKLIVKSKLNVKVKALSAEDYQVGKSIYGI